MSHSQILTSPPDRDSLLNSVIEVAFWTAVWFGISKLTRLAIYVPPSIAKEEDKKKREAKIDEYVNYLVSLYHAIFLMVTSAYAFMRYPNIRNRPYSEFELFFTKVG